jgi:hypothetical protein
MSFARAAARYTDDPIRIVIPLVPSGVEGSDQREPRDLSSIAERPHTRAISSRNSIPQTAKYAEAPPRECVRMKGFFRRGEFIPA